MAGWHAASKLKIFHIIVESNQLPLEIFISMPTSSINILAACKKVLLII
jgi:hypothetical protein